MIKILKNLSENDITIRGQKLMPEDTFQVEAHDDPDYRTDESIHAEILNGNLSVSSSVGEFSVPAVGLEWFKYSCEAYDTHFANHSLRGNHIQAKNSQEAIEEVKYAGRYTMVLTHDGGVHNRTYIGHSKQLKGNETPVIIPKNSVLEEVTFSNKVDDADFDLELRKNSIDAEVFKTISIIQKQTHIENSVNQEFNQGESIYIKYVDYGKNAKDVAIQLVFRIL